MKIRITFKDPDGVDVSLEDWLNSWALEKLSGESEELKEIMIEKKSDEIKEKIRPWVEYGEYITIEFDLDEQTASVVKQK